MGREIPPHRVGQAVATYRHMAGLSQWGLAEKTGITRSSIANIEVGRQDLTVTRLLVLSEALDVGPAVLLGDVPDSAVVEALEEKVSELRGLVVKAQQLLTGQESPETRTGER